MNKSKAIYPDITAYTRIGVVGSRNYPNLNRVRKFVKSLAKRTIIITGRDIGVDTVVEDEARKRGMRVEIHEPDEIAENIEILVAFWHGQSRGTAKIIRQVQQENKRMILK